MKEEQKKLISVISRLTDVYELNRNKNKELAESTIELIKDLKRRYEKIEGSELMMELITENKNLIQKVKTCHGQK